MKKKAGEKRSSPLAPIAILLNYFSRITYKRWQKCAMPPESATSGSAAAEEPQDTDYSSYLPPLTDEVSLLILARTPFSDHPTLRCLSCRHRTLLESGDLYRTCQAHDLCHPIVFMHAGGPTVWRYELGANRWFQGPDMLSKHSLFSSASSGSCAFVAGGCAYITSSLTARVPTNSAEQYDPETLTRRPLPPTHRKRTHCSGFFMNSKFYVVGGEGVNRDDLKCGEFYDPKMNEWVLVEGMLGDRPIPTGSDGRPLSRSQPLVLIVNGCELYEMEPCMNVLIGGQALGGWEGWVLRGDGGRVCVCTA
ncbi:hypothetical protein AMTR_s00013p00225330 [Amborella trichopoda]|uniref:F-box domain-containing protein n=1 Tax=Amborella trichopoda TaxID=13333 RepID=W1PQA3_AMBTC|nr:hypothetical protein AMTR_s00013p00225330 [Amborella trichopoda]